MICFKLAFFALLYAILYIEQHAPTNTWHLVLYSVTEGREPEEL
jgi:hypothetical protein